MKKEIEEKLAASLTAETIELLPFLPYLLQDFWELGSDPNVMVKLIEKHACLSKGTKILDLACGKGAVSIKIAEKLQIKVKGIDLIPSFIEFAIQKAKEHNVSRLCEFKVENINESVKIEKNYDCVIFGASGNVLGNPLETLNKLIKTIKPEGYILIDEAYIPDNINHEDIKYNNYEYLTEKQWLELFKQTGLELIETIAEFSDDICSDSDLGMSFINLRANELIKKHPNKKDIFESYIRSQQNEYDDIENNLVAVTWILKKAIKQS